MSKKKLIIKSLQTTGTAPCNKYNCCRYTLNATQITLPNGREYRFNLYANYQTVGIVYYMECECKAFYVRKTKRLFFHRVAKKKLETLINQHMGLYHGFQLSKMKFFALEHVSKH